MNKSIFTYAALAAVSAGFVGSLGLSGCGDPQMYCLAPSDGFAVTYSKVSGDDNCIPDHGVIGLDYYLGFNGEGKGPIASPENAQLAFTPRIVRDKIEEAETHIAQLALYKKCMGDAKVDIQTEFSLEFTKQPFYSIGKYTNPTPSNGQCTIGQLSEASLVIPAMPAVPECKTKDMEVPKRDAFAAVDVKYKSLSTEMTVTEAIQGLYAKGQFEYNGTREDGSRCSGTYAYEGINPVLGCMTNKECEDFKGTPEKPPKILIDGAVECRGAVPNEDPKKAVKGICVLKPL